MSVRGRRGVNAHHRIPGRLRVARRLFFSQASTSILSSRALWRTDWTTQVRVHPPQKLLLRRRKKTRLILRASTEPDDHLAIVNSLANPWPHTRGNAGPKGSRAPALQALGKRKAPRPGRRCSLRPAQRPVVFGGGSEHEQEQLSSCSRSAAR